MTQTTLFKARRLLAADSSRIVEDGAVLVDGERIVAAGAMSSIGATEGAAIIDLGDRTLMPGLIDAHMHFMGVASDKLHQMITEDDAVRVLQAAGEARKMLDAGITAARCMGSNISPALRKGIEAGFVPGPRLVVSGNYITATNGTWDHTDMPLDYVRSRGMLADGPDAVRAKVRERIRQGATVIKTGLSKGTASDRYHAWGEDPYTNQPVYSMDELLALTDEAHLNGMKVAAHCIGDGAVRMALDGGVDVIEHGYAITEDTRRRLVERQIIVVSTISQLYFHITAFEKFSHYTEWEKATYRRHMDVMRSDFKKSVDAGVRYALGTDLIGPPTHPLDAVAKEFEYAVEWGMSPEQAILAGTLTAAEALGWQDRIGGLQEGKFADLIAVSGNPFDDVTALQRVDYVVQGGRVVADRT